MYCFKLLVITALISFASTEVKSVDIQTGHDPGSCRKTESGLLKLIKNRLNNDKLLICTEQNGVYGWKTTDGSNPSGEYFSPGYDCTDILKKNFEARDGFYWIHLNQSVPRRVYCDMTTDGGGFALIGKLDSSVTWNTPSKNTTVHPYGETQWSSDLGDAPVLDFRIQVSTTENLAKSDAHWSYRLRNTRPLKNIMIINQGGCSASSPGIGDIAYVKDLQTEKIVTTKFRCSQFGMHVHYRNSLKIGWAMMNECFEKQCPYGFAFHQRYRTQMTASGSFSYSVVSSASGIRHNSTAFIGCDNAVCCSCFSPPGSREDLCGTNCRTKPGATLKKNVYSWFWVRSSFPKKVWNKCPCKDSEASLIQLKLGQVNAALAELTARLDNLTRASETKGNAGDSLAYHNKMQFSTKDRDNDASNGDYNCADYYKGAWWHENCYESSLNGLYLSAGQYGNDTGIRWNRWNLYSFKKTEMKIRPNKF